MLEYSNFMKGKTQKGLLFHQIQCDFQKKKFIMTFHGFSESVLKFA